MVDFICNTDGSGLWSNKKSSITIDRILVTYVNEENTFGELKVYFDAKNWDIKNDGLIYTDPLFEEQLIRNLNRLGYSANKISYSEQGMQGDNFVSLNVNKEFLDSYYKIHSL